jgi:predicted protein tyrosine phosphatase
MSREIKVLTVCRVGLSRSVALTDVLKFHFPAADVIPAGFSENSPETLAMLVNWADIVIVMREKFREELSSRIGGFPPGKTVLVCEVGPDVDGYAGVNRANLINKVWVWARANLPAYGITEVSH